jgi:hypothetical protein
MPAFLIGVAIGYLVLKTFGSPALYALLGAIQGTFAGLVLWSICVFISPEIFFGLTQFGLAAGCGMVTGVIAAARHHG